MVISHRKKFIFVHNYKVAGTSLRRSLRKYDDKSPLKSPLQSKLPLLFGIYPRIYSNNYPTHITTAELKEQLPLEIFESYYKFGFVRNPWDWQVSLYSFMCKNEKHFQHELAKSMSGFEEYIHWRVNEEVRLQRRFFYDEDGNCLVDHIGKIENLADELGFLSNKLNLNLRLHHLNKSRDDNKYKKMYTKETLDMVTNAFKEDIETFGYEIPELD